MELKPGYKLTEVGVIPDDWSVARLDSITDPRRPISYGIVQTGHLINNGVRCVRVVDIENGRINPNNLITTSHEISESYRRTVLQEGDLVIALRGKIGELARVDSGLVGANLTRGVAILSQNEAHDSKYLLHYLSSPISKRILERNLNGSALQEIPIATLRRIPAVIPPPAEQRAIAGALSDVDALIGALDQLLAKKRDLKQAAMQQLLTGHQRLPGFAPANPRFQQTEAGLIPDDWEVRTLGSMTTLLTNGFVGKATDFYVDSDDGVLYIQGYNVEENAFNLHGIKRISHDFHRRHQKSCLQPGDLLTIQTGDIGVTAVVPEEFAGANCHALVISRLISQIAAPGFYCYLFNSERGRADFKEIETGSTMKHLNIGDMAQLYLPSPTLAEQTAIAEVLSDMDAELAALEQKRDKTRLLKQGMMQELLTGRTRLV